MSISSSLSPATILIATLFNAPTRSKRPRVGPSAHAILHRLLATPSAIALIEGPSGSGKSTLLSCIAKLAKDKDCSLARVNKNDLRPCSRVIDYLIELMLVAPRPQSFNALHQAASLLSACGLGEPSLWLRRPKLLSDSEQARFTLACAIARGGVNPDSAPFIVVIDEFLSTLDRITAQATCAAIARLLKTRPAIRLLAATAHTDLASFLEPLFVVRRGSGSES